MEIGQIALDKSIRNMQRDGSPKEASIMPLQRSVTPAVDGSWLYFNRERSGIRCVAQLSTLAMINLLNGYLALRCNLGNRVLGLVSRRWPGVCQWSTKYAAACCINALFALSILSNTSCGGSAGMVSAPAPPTNVIAVAGNGNATVSFSKPSDDGGSPVSGYTVESNPEGGIDSNAGSTALAHVVSGLTHGYPYRFAVRAVNAVGVSAPSVESLGVIPTSKVPSGLGLWRVGRSLPVDRMGHSTTLLPNAKVLVVGGAGGGAILASAELYNRATDQWESAGPLLVARQSHTATLLKDGKVLVVGGISSGAYPSLASAEIYDPVANRWSTTGPLQQGRALHSATLLRDGKVLVVAGDAGGTSLSDSFFPHPLATAELFDPATNRWTSVSALSTPRWWHTATRLANGNVLVAGGAMTDGKHSIPVKDSAVFEVQTQTWRSVAFLNSERFGHTATLLPNGGVLLTGGFGVTGNLGSSEIFDPVANVWNPAGQLASPRSAHTATLLANGKVLVVGGSTYASMASAEIYSPDSKAWRPTASLLTAREAHGATLLADGTVLVAGGYNSTALNRLSSVEIYDTEQ